SVLRCLPSQAVDQIAQTAYVQELAVSGVDDPRVRLQRSLLQRVGEGDAGVSVQADQPPRNGVLPAAGQAGQCDVGVHARSSPGRWLYHHLASQDLTRVTRPGAR